MALADRPRPRVELVSAPLERHLFAFVWLPRDMLSTGVRLQIQALVEDGTRADTLDWSLMVEGGNWRCCATCSISAATSIRPTPQALDRRLQDMLRGWREAVEAELLARSEPGRAAALAARFAEAFPQAYRNAYGPAEAARDIDRLRQLSRARSRPPARARRAALSSARRRRENELRLKIYQQGGSMPLVRRRPGAGELRLSRAVGAADRARRTASGRRSTTSSCCSTAATTAPTAARASGDRSSRRSSAVLNGLAEDDVFNRLVIGTALAAREANWLRAFYRYLRQGGLAVHDLHRGRCVARGARRHPRPRSADPRLSRSGFRRRPRLGERRSARSRSATGLAHVAAINDDRLLRALLGDDRRDRCAPTPSRRPPAKRSPSSSIRPRCRACRSRCRGARSGSIRAGSRASTCAPARSRAAASAGPTGATTSAPRSSG